MTTDELFTAVAKLSGLLLVVYSMLLMGMSLTRVRILQPLKDPAWWSWRNWRTL